MAASDASPRGGPASAGTSLDAAVAGALRLALGSADARGDAGIAAADWPAVFDVAARECLGALAWSRSGALIRRTAPPEVVARWRAHAVTVTERTRAQLSVLGEMLEALRAAGVDPVVLKGAPLAQRLHGDPLVRYSADLDLYVPLPQRGAARAALTAAGWGNVNGEAPWEESMQLRRGGMVYHAELHSALMDDILHHLPVPAPDSERVEVEGVAMRAMSGPLLPSYLATHMSKHRVAPLLWAVDLTTLWHQLGEPERARAQAAAHAAGLVGYLRWGVRLTRDVVSASEGNARAVRRLGFAHARLRSEHPAVRDVMLAPSVGAAARVIIAWLAPARARTSGRAFAVRTARRVLHPLRWMRRQVLYHAPAVAPAALELDGESSGGAALREAERWLPISPEDLAGLAGEVLAHGQEIWLRVRGTSMQPSIPGGADVRVVPLGGRAPALGDIVLARLPNGAVVVHRVVAVEPERLALRGDNVIATDPPVAPGDVLGRIVAVRTGAGVVAPRPAPLSLRLAPARARRWLSARLRTLA